MVRNWLKDMCKYAVWSSAVLLATAGAARAQNVTPDVQAKLAAQQREIDELKRLIQSGAVRPAGSDAADPAAPKPLTDQDVQGIIKNYLDEHPASAKPGSFKIGYEAGKGLAINNKSDDPSVKWNDTTQVPFELRFRGRGQFDYYNYNPTDTLNHLTGVRNGNAVAVSQTAPTLSEFEVKRVRLIFEGYAFSPDLKYHFELDGNTRGLAAVTTRQNFFANPEGNVQGGQTIAAVDGGVRLFQAWISYDWHPFSSDAACDACPGAPAPYKPTITGIVGKFKPFGSLEEYLGSGNQQFVEYSMGSWMFDSDADNMLTGVALQAKLFDDRFFGMVFITNGNDNQLPFNVLGNLPGFNFGSWFDFGGTYDEQKGKWKLFGDTLSDLDYSCNPVARVGWAANLVPQARRSLYTTAELDFTRAGGSAGPGGTTLTGILNGAGVAPGTLPGITPATTLAGLSPFGVDAFDTYTLDLYAAAKYRGFSVYNEWWLRDLDNFRGTELANGQQRAILYTSNSPTGATAVSVFPHHAILDYGTTVQTGYFLIPHKLEVAGRFSWVRGASSDINGDRSGSATLTPAQVAALNIPAGTTVTAVRGAFRTYSEATEWAIGVNYFFHGQACKWSTDVSFYNGGNPAANGSSPAGFLPGVDGWMIRTQLQFAF
jgi:hypothetical protein